MNTAHKGRRAEHRARRLLEAAGYTVTRAAASKGVADLVAWNATGFRLVSVKAGGRYASRAERAALAGLAVPAHTSKEIWRFPARCKAPSIEVL